MVCQSCIEAIQAEGPYDVPEDIAEDLAQEVGAEVAEHNCDSDDCLCACKGRD